MKSTKIIGTSEPELRGAAGCLKNGGLVIFPTETVYGLGANALSAESALKIYAAKDRPADNPLICHLDHPHEAEKYCETTPLYYALAEKFMPGPLTVILKKKSGDRFIPAETTGGLDTVAVRIPSDNTARRLIEYAGVPIAAPSANRSGRPSLTAMRHIIEDMFGRVDYIIDGGDSPIGLESTIVMPQGETLRLLRPGAVTAEQLCGVGADVVVEKSVYEKFDGAPLAPGMKYRHYAPDERVVLLDGTDSEVYNFLSDKNGCASLCYDEDLDMIGGSVRCFSMGAKSDTALHAHNLFAALRDLDGKGTIYVRMPSKEGLGLAVFNRLIKAAGYEILQLGDKSTDGTQKST